jgi:hypothetical protein
MPRIALSLTLATGAALIAAGAGWSQAARHHGGGTVGSDAAAIRSAMSAAPPAVARGATIMAMGAHGAMRTLRRGNNGFTCFPDNPRSPGADPMCADANAMGWAAAFMSGSPPPAGGVGLMYMLAGGVDASNTDPHAERPARGGAWVRTGPHVMVVGSDSILANYPSGPRPDTSRPYVMYAGTPYAHLMVPVR